MLKPIRSYSNWQEDFVEGALALSTCHMPEANPDFGELCAALTPWTYGYVVFAEWDDDDEPEDRPYFTGTSKWMEAVHDLAKELKCKYIVFDQNAAEFDELERWEW